MLNIPSLRLSGVNEHSISVSRTNDACQIKRVPDCTSMVCAVIHDVKGNLLARHASPLSIDKLKTEYFPQLMGLKLHMVRNTPSIGCANSSVQFSKIRHLLCIG